MDRAWLECQGISESGMAQGVNKDIAKCNGLLLQQLPEAFEHLCRLLCGIGPLLPCRLLSYKVWMVLYFLSLVEEIVDLCVGVIALKEVVCMVGCMV